MEKDFETMLKEMSDTRKRQESMQYNSLKGKAYEVIVDFKCWAFSKGHFDKLDSRLFAEYTKEQSEIPEDIKRYIAEKYFGYELKYDYDKMIWKTVKKGNLILNV